MAMQIRVRDALARAFAIPTGWRFILKRTARCVAGVRLICGWTPLVCHLCVLQHGSSQAHAMPSPALVESLHGRWQICRAVPPCPWTATNPWYAAPAGYPRSLQNTIPMCAEKPILGRACV